MEGTSLGTQGRCVWCACCCGRVSIQPVLWNGWQEEGPEAEPWDGEDPLERGVKYDPVMTKDGFIHPREQPKKIVRPERCVIGEGGVFNW